MISTAIHKLSTQIRQTVGKIAIFQYIVDKTVVSNYYTFQFLVSTFSTGLAGKQIREIYSQDPDELAVAFHGYTGQLVFLCRPDMSTVYLQENRSRARRNSVDLLGECAGARVSAVRMSPADRILFFDLDDGKTLAAVLYGPGANVLLTERSGTILDSFKNAKKLRGSVIPFAAAAPPDGFHAFRTACASAESRPVVSLIRKSFPVFGGTLALESAARAGIDASLTTGGLDPSACEAVEAGIRSVLDDIATPLPRVYISSEGVPAYFSLIPLRIAGAMREERFSDASSAIRFYIAGRGARRGHERDMEAIVSPLRQQIDKGKRTLRAIQTDAREGDRAGTYERFASALMAALPVLTKGMKSFEAEIGGERVAIPLDPALSPVQNAQRYFERAKRAKAAAVESTRRLREVSARIEQLENLIAGAERLPPEVNGKKFMDDNAAEFEAVGLGPRAREKERLPFRIFTVDGGFEVWAGKNSANNDLLTLRYAKPDDLWFHARGGSGSHVVLKIRSGKGEPGKKACQQAAAIAAYYSKMKTAGTVAVAMTEKRYVRKPRGSPPGTVMIEREKVIFAQPALPREAGN
jgi:predicted ribosome quality control (RQC) complex YloA/Tae2 family protein